MAGISQRGAFRKLETSGVRTPTVKATINASKSAHGLNLLQKTCPSTVAGTIKATAAASRELPMKAAMEARTLKAQKQTYWTKSLYGGLCSKISSSRSDAPWIVPTRIIMRLAKLIVEASLSALMPLAKGTVCTIPANDALMFRVPTSKWTTGNSIAVQTWKTISSVSAALWPKLIIARLNLRIQTTGTAKWPRPWSWYKRWISACVKIWPGARAFWRRDCRKLSCSPSSALSIADNEATESSTLENPPWQSTYKQGKLSFRGKSESSSESKDSISEFWMPTLGSHLGPLKVNTSVVYSACKWLPVSSFSDAQANPSPNPWVVPQKVAIGRPMT